MSGGGKGGKQTSTVELPKDVTKAAKENMALAKEVGSLPYAPFFGGSVAAFTPAQEAGFSNMNKAASAFGLQGQAGAGLPKSQDFGGVQGYSTEGVYKDAMSRVDPKVLELYNSFFFPNKRVGGQQTQAPAPAKQQPMYGVDQYGNPIMLSQPRQSAGKGGAL